MVATMLSLALFLLLSLTGVGPIHAAVVPGASGDSSSLSASWRWSYLDPTPGPSRDGRPFPFKLGVADRDQRDKAGERFVPAIRYAHSAVLTADGQDLIVTHGYHYDISPVGGGATWLSDTWRFRRSTQRWARLHDHVRHPDEGPLARYAAVAVLFAGDMYLHGGDDGGHAQQLMSYQHAIYGDMWRFVLTPSSSGHELHTWIRMRAVVGRAPIGPAAHLPLLLDPRLSLDGLYRCQHAAAMVPLGSDSVVWQADAEEERGEALARDQPAPYLFATHGLYAVERESGSGSTRYAASDETFDVLDGSDVWVYSWRTRQWRQLRTSQPPPPRFGHALVYVPERQAEQEEVGAQPKGALVLYGGFSRSGENRGDLWMLQLQSSAEHAAFTWHELHSNYPDGSRLSPGRRGYFNLWWTPDHWLHLFGGARCQPGCVCSAEYWIYQLGKQQALSDAAATGSTSADSHWQLVCNSPHSPSSHAYPLRSASGEPHHSLYTRPDESVTRGWPVHRYKQSMVHVLPPLPPLDSDSSNAAADVTLDWSSLMFGGESYNPSGYYQDTWQLDYTRRVPRDSPLIAAVRYQHALAALLHTQPLPIVAHITRLPHDADPRGIHRHDPPGGWPPFTRTHRAGQQPLEWPNATLPLQRDSSQPESISLSLLTPLAVGSSAAILLILLLLWVRRSGKVQKRQ